MWHALDKRDRLSIFACHEHGLSRVLSRRNARSDHVNVIRAAGHNTIASLAFHSLLRAPGTPPSRADTSLDDSQEQLAASRRPWENTRKWGWHSRGQPNSFMHVHHKCKWFLCRLAPNQAYARLLTIEHGLITWVGLARGAARNVEGTCEHTIRSASNTSRGFLACYG